MRFWFVCCTFIDVGTSSKPNLSNIMEKVLKVARHVFHEKPWFLLTTHATKR